MTWEREHCWPEGISTHAFKGISSSEYPHLPRDFRTANGPYICSVSPDSTPIRPPATNTSTKTLRLLWVIWLIRAAVKGQHGGKMNGGYGYNNSGVFRNQVDPIQPTSCNMRTLSAMPLISKSDNVQWMRCLNPWLATDKRTLTRSC